MAKRNKGRVDQQALTTNEQAKGVKVCGQPGSALLTAWVPDQPFTIRLKQFLKVTGLGRSTAFKMWNPRSPLFDARMPRGFKLFNSPNAPRFFFYRDVVEWLMFRAEQYRANPSAKEGVLEA